MSEGKFFVCNRIDDHGDDGATFYCDKCKNMVIIDMYDIFMEEDGFKCPICGANKEMVARLLG